MLLDTLFAILLIIGFIRGWKKGFLWAIISVIASFVAVMVSLKYAPALANNFLKTNSFGGQYSTIISFGILFFIIIFIFRLVVKAVETFLQFTMMGWVNNALGAMLYMFVVSFVMSAFLWVFNVTHLSQIFNFTNAKTFSFLEPIAPKTIEIFTPYIPFLKDLYSNFETILNK